jgi:ABC-type antimicrobial peptide transport system permease subunit
MIRNYIRTAWRNLVKNKTTAFVNVAGLSVAFVCSILLFLIVQFEFSFDRFQQNRAHLYEVYNVSYTENSDEKSTTMGYPVAPALKTEVPGIIRATPFMPAGAGIRYKSKEINPSIHLVSNDFFSMFSFPVIAGNAGDLLADVGHVVLSRSTAAALFGKAEEAPGKTVSVKVSGEWKDLVVSGVLEDAPLNSSLQYSILARIEINGSYPELKNNWNAQHHPVYVQTGPATTQAQAEAGLRRMVQKLHLEDDDFLKSKGYRKDAYGHYFAMKLNPFTNLHFDEELGVGNTVSKSYLYILILIAVVVLVIACFNFINLNVARSFTRAKEVGVRKTIGAGKKQIFFQLWTESLLLCSVAVLLAFGIAMLVLQPFNHMFTEKLQLSHMLQPGVIAAIVGGMLLVSFLAGGYPAWLVSRFQAVEVLKGKVSMNRSSLLRNGLITFQFVMASLLICSTFIIYRQFRHMRSAPLGFEQESVISIPVKQTENTRQYTSALRAKLSSQPQVVSVTASSVNIGIGEDYSQSSWGVGFTYKGKSIESNILIVDYDYLKTLGIQPIAGRDFSRAFPSDTSRMVNNVVVTQSMAQQFAFDTKNAVGLSFYSDSAKPKWNIIGIIPDFHLYSMHQKMIPLTLEMNPKMGLNYILVKVKTRNPVQAMQLIQSAYKELEPDNSINASYLTENTRRWYEKEQKLSSIFFTAASIAIILSCLGLFAIVALVMEQRRKEIGVRKVLGASVQSITTLLSKDFIQLVVLAFLIATPIAWYGLHRWLQAFQYRTRIQWWVFPAAGLLLLLIALLTISIQTIRASLANPVKSLRTE